MRARHVIGVGGIGHYLHILIPGSKIIHHGDKGLIHDGHFSGSSVQPERTTIKTPHMIGLVLHGGNKIPQRIDHRNFSTVGSSHSLNFLKHMRMVTNDDIRPPFGKVRSHVLLTLIRGENIFIAPMAR